MDARPLVMHVVYRFAVGGLENGIVNLINRLPEQEFRHAVVALTDCDERFCRRVTGPCIGFFSIGKGAGHGWRVFPRLWRLFRDLRPAVVHTRNLAALEMQLPAWAAGVPVRIHGEHGRDIFDPDGSNRAHRFMRRVYSPFVNRYVAVSAELETYLVRDVGIDARRVQRICNGVDATRYIPGTPSATVPGRPVVVGAVGRLQQIKGHATLIAAVDELVTSAAASRERLRVKLVGDGPLREQLEREIARRGLEDVVELLGERDDVASVMQTFDVFVLPSLAEGISNTILEAMACGLPVVATDVGGNSELVRDGKTGMLVPPADPSALAAALKAYLHAPELRRAHGEQARKDVDARFALPVMVEQYRALYRASLRARPGLFDGQSVAT